MGSSGLLSLGAGIYQNTNYHAKGLTISPANNNEVFHNYEYRLQSTRFMVETQLAWQINFLNEKKLIPFISFGVGPSLNYANHYEEGKNMLFDRSSFGSKTNTGFAYQLGVGLAFPFNTDHDRLFAAYRFVDLGVAKFAVGTNTDHDYNPGYLNVGRVRSSEVCVGYTHLFDF